MVSVSPLQCDGGGGDRGASCVATLPTGELICRIRYVTVCVIVSRVH